MTSQQLPEFAVVKGFTVSFTFKGNGDIDRVWNKLTQWLPERSAITMKPDAEGIYSVYLKPEADKELAQQFVTGFGFQLLED